MNITVWTHLVYLTLSIVITVWVGRTLQRHGKVFAMGGNNGSQDDETLVESFSRLLEMGFYLLSFAAVNLTLRYGETVRTLQDAIELLSTKIGVVLLVLGFVHLVMTGVFSGSRNRGRETGSKRGESLLDPSNY